MKSDTNSEDTVRRHLKGVNTKKAPDPDGVSPHRLRHYSKELTRPPHADLPRVSVVQVLASMWKEQISISLALLDSQ